MAASTSAACSAWCWTALPVAGLYISTGWGTGGFKAIPAGGETLAYTIANDRPQALIEPFGLDRFAKGLFINEAAAAGVAH